ncbi:MAG: CPBP family intramembrane metalloprotease [Lachnospiraceae bacterium]|nr:CPBP family intramembrane metalloprotease [Lachnospiraceae bacterium]
MQPVCVTSAAKAWKIFLPIFCYYFVTLLLRTLLTPVQIMQGDSPLLSGAAMLGGAAFVWLLVRKDDLVLPAGSFLRSMLRGKDTRGIGKRLWDRHSILLMGASVCIGLAVNSWFFLLGITTGSDSYAQVAAAQFSLPFWMAVLLYGCLTPIAEEWVFRGVVYRRMRGYYGKKTALFGSALVFGVFHGNPVQAAYGMLLGILLALCCDRYESILLPMVLHGGINVAVYAATVIPSVNKAVFSPFGAMVLSVSAGMAVWWMGTPGNTGKTPETPEKPKDDSSQSIFTKK